MEMVRMVLTLAFVAAATPVAAAPGVRVYQTKDPAITEGETVIDGDAAEIYATVLDYSRWTEIFPDVAKVVITAQNGQDARVTLIAPETVYLSADTTFGKDVTIEPFVVIGPGVSIDDGAVIHSFTHIVQSRIGKNALVGPYARLRPGTSLGEGAKIGNFVEAKAATLEAGVKVNHLSYIGDAHVGALTNIGAGTITCNYDGFFKHKTTIGKGAFIGTNTSLVAPVNVGDGAYIGSGSVITKDVPADALAVERGQQTNREGGASRIREIKTRGKKPKHD
jgi:bifunctional UDP-N-acetylglucosamine pyrophosphorylase/glucosamine-1-phosphate N-acetyltransferase